MAIKFKNLTKSFVEQKVLDGIDLEIADGQTTVIVGSSGSGKSTMLRCINLLEIPEEGELELDGEKIKFGGKISPKELLPFRR